MYSCEICNSTGKERALIGNYQVVLCTRHFRKLHIHISEENRELYIKYNRARASHSACIRGGLAATASDKAEYMIELDSKLFRICDEWMIDNKEV